MPIDPTGTSPHAVPEKPAEDVVNMRCRRDGCDSITAVQFQIPTQPGRRLYRCTKCRHSWGLNVGGHLDI